METRAATVVFMDISDLLGMESGTVQRYGKFRNYPVRGVTAMGCCATADCPLPAPSRGPLKGHNTGISSIEKTNTMTVRGRPTRAKSKNL